MLRVLLQSSHATHASYARNVRPELCVHGTMAEVLGCMYAGPAGMEKLALDLETGKYEQTKIIPGKSGQATVTSVIKPQAQMLAKVSAEDCRLQLHHNEFKLSKAC